MNLFGSLHLGLLAATAALVVLLTMWVRRRPHVGRTVRLVLGAGLIANELVWWAFRYSHEGIHTTNMPLQLCDMTLWMTALACLTLARPIVEFAYFAGIGGAGMALLTPDLWSPWPSYPAIYFFVAHAGIVIGATVLVWGGIVPLKPGCIRRAFGVLCVYAAFAGLFNVIFGTNYMYLCRKPASASLLDALGPWPVYLLVGAAVALCLFGLLLIPARMLTLSPASDATIRSGNGQSRDRVPARRDGRPDGDSG